MGRKIEAVALRKQEIKIVLRRNGGFNDWTLELDDALHRHIPSDALECLVEAKLISAMYSLETEADDSSQTTRPPVRSARTLFRPSR